jgi:hypothetical protein
VVDGKVVQAAGTYDFQNDGIILEPASTGPTRSRVRPATSFGPARPMRLIAELGVGSVTASALQMGLGMAAIFVSFGATVLLTGLGLVWASRPATDEGQGAGIQAGGDPRLTTTMGPTTRDRKHETARPTAPPFRDSSERTRATSTRRANPRRSLRSWGVLWRGRAELGPLPEPGPRREYHGWRCNSASPGRQSLHRFDVQRLEQAGRRGGHPRSLWRRPRRFPRFARLSRLRRPRGRRRTSA